MKKLQAFILILLIPVLMTAGNPRNIILMISDGCGYNQILATDYYQYGEAGYQVYEEFPVQFGMSTYPAGTEGYDPEKAWNDTSYVSEFFTDSAASATAMATGYMTKNGMIGQDSLQNNLMNIIDRTKDLGKAAGVVTSVTLSDGTPAAFIAHNHYRSNYEEIAREMFLDSRTDLIMGCGNPWYDHNGSRLEIPYTYKYVGGRAIWEGLVAGKTDFDLDLDGKIDNSVEDIDHDGEPDNWFLIQDRDEFLELASGPAPKRVLGIPRVYKTLQAYRDGESLEPFSCPCIETVPTLVEMTAAAINILDENPAGFFLLIEGGAIDKACHANNISRMIEEEMDFNQTVEQVILWIETNSSWDETLLIVTADHECGYLTGPESDQGLEPYPLNRGKGELPGIKWNSGSHTNSLVPLFAKGQGSEGLQQFADEIDPVRGKYLHNTELGTYLHSLMK